MNWNRHKSVKLSKAFVLFFALMILAMYGYCIFRIISPAPGQLKGFTTIKIIACICSIPAWAALRAIWQILKRIQTTASIFSSANIRSMRCISWCCMTVAAICFFSSFFFPILLIVSAAAAFMGLIVRIVKDAFQQAIEMKDELDFTI